MNVKPSTRILNPADIPSSLWDQSKSTLHVAPLLAKAYRTVMDHHGLNNPDTLRSSKDSPVGGLSKELAEQHFAQAFDGSAARAQLAILDPKGEVEPTSDTFISSLSGNKLCLTDAPCGAGAAALAFLCTITELREKRVLPRQPLDVYLLGAELSKFAIGYANDLLAELILSFEAQGIFVRAEFVSWDATDSISTTDLIVRMMELSSPNHKCLLVIANFSGFLNKQGKQKVVKPQLETLFRFASNRDSQAVWIEPCMNAAICQGGVIPWLRKLVSGDFKLFAREKRNMESEPVAMTSARFVSPLCASRNHPVNLAVMPIDLVRSK